MILAMQVQDASAAPHPTPDPAIAAASDSAATFGRFVGFLHKLIDYGQRLAVALQREGDAVGAAHRFLAFGTTDLRLILARIARGLRRAQALEASLQSHPARLKDQLFRYPAPAAPGGHPPCPRPAPRLSRAEREQQENVALLAGLPTVAELARQIRRRTPGAVLVDICRDLGIGLDHPLYPEFSALALLHAGNTLRLDRAHVSRMSAPRPHADPDAPPDTGPPGLPPPAAREPAIAATGPP